MSDETTRVCLEDCCACPSFNIKQLQCMSLLDCTSMFHRIKINFGSKGNRINDLQNQKIIIVKQNMACLVSK